MSFSTRSVTRSVAATHASNRIIRTQCFVHSVQELHHLASDCVYRPAVALSVEFMHIAFVHEALAATAMLRMTLNNMQNLTDLILLFPQELTAPLLTKLYLPQLRLFKSNIPHTKILPFLLSHADTRVNEDATLKSLILDSCGGRSRLCPLRRCVMNNITELECPLSCVGLAMGSAVERLTTWHRARMPSASDLIASLPPAPLLTFLSIEVFAGDIPVLLRLPKFAPGVESLKVIEVDNNAAVISSGHRLVNSHRLWALMITRLAHLRTLLVRTDSDFVSDPGNENQEKKRLRLLLTGKSLGVWERGQRLKRIGVHYGPGVGGLISHWDVSQDWIRYAHTPCTVAENLLM